MSSQRTSTKKMYEMYIRKWKRYAGERQVFTVSLALEVAVNYLASLVE